MAECKCEDPKWRIKRKKPKGRDYQYLLVCLTCEDEWWIYAPKRINFS